MSVYKTGKYDSWLLHANERNVLERVLHERKDEWLSPEGISIVDVGCGTGAGSSRIFKVLDHYNVPFVYTGVEPFQEMLDKFPQRPETTLVKSTLEDFEPKEPADLVTAIHSLYYVADQTEALRRMSRMGKRMLIVYHGERGINQVHQQFPKLVAKGKHLISTHNDITDKLDELGIKYDCRVYETQVDIRPCKEEGNVHGKNLITFFLEQEEISKETESRVREYLRTLPDFMTHEMGVIITK
ncbi:MAG: class I SAM-dependent methyltransferase [Candidatus Woesearchaeota archaeon]